MEFKVFCPPSAAFFLIGINRIRLEFKVYREDNLRGTLHRINRIRLEFKATTSDKRSKTEYSINRIRLEFKGGDAKDIWLAVRDLIESDWNLKYLAVGDNLSLKDVLIESDWNLKSDRYSFRLYRPGINRIRLEFKDAYLKTLPIFEGVLIESYWNLKDISPDSSPRLHGVLIESDWNLRII